MSENAEGRQLLRRIDDLISEGEYDSAIELSRELLRRAPDKAGQAWLSIAVSEERAGRPTAALPAFRRALALALYTCERPPLPVLNHLGVVLYDMGLYARAAVCHRLTCDREPKAYRFVMLARCLYRLGLVKEAIHAAEDAIECDEAYDEAYHMLGVYLRDLDPARAADCLKKALALDPKRARTYASLAELAWREGDWRRVVERARQGLAIDPDNVLCWVRLAEAMERLGEVEEAERAFRSGLRSHGDENETWARREFAGLLRRQGRHDEAIDEFEYVLRGWPDEAESYECYAAFLEDAPGLADRAAEIRERLARVSSLLGRV